MPERPDLSALRPFMLQVRKDGLRLRFLQSALSFSGGGNDSFRVNGILVRRTMSRRGAGGRTTASCADCRRSPPSRHSSKSRARGRSRRRRRNLALSPPALSRRIQALERFIGRPLFERRHQAVVLNADGERLLTQIAPALDQLSDAVEVMTSNTDVLRLRLGILPLFASQRLFPRLGELRTRSIPSYISTSIRRATVWRRLGEGLDAVIALAREIDPALYARTARPQSGLCHRRACADRAARSGRSGPEQLSGPDRARPPRHARYVQCVARGGGARRPGTARDRPFRFRVS